VKRSATAEEFPALADEVVRGRCAHLSATDLRLARLWLKVLPSDIDGPPVGLVVGEAPLPNTSGRLPMFPYPASSAAGRLLKMSELKPGQYLGRLHRRDEYPGPRWDLRAANQRAKLIHEWAASGEGVRRVLLLGKNVATAFGMDLWGYVVSGGEVAVEYRSIAHPSGANPMYNAPTARLAAQAAVLWAAGYF
jgi:hypothetical protein